MISELRNHGSYMCLRYQVIIKSNFAVNKRVTDVILRMNNKQRYALNSYVSILMRISDSIN